MGNGDSISVQRDSIITDTERQRMIAAAKRLGKNRDINRIFLSFVESVAAAGLEASAPYVKRDTTSVESLTPEQLNQQQEEALKQLQEMEKQMLLKNDSIIFNLMK